MIYHFFEVMSFIKRKQIRIPEELAVIVFDNIPFADISTPTITTIAQPAYEIGKRASELLTRQIKQEAIESELYTFPCELIIRESSAGRP
ncbi:hypothetical protein GCM10020331_057900 [Ectobacillus funiculus]